MKELSDVRHLFGENRAEWSADAFKDLFVEPGYIKRLQSRKPSFIVGGRGTGKTTSLMSLKFEAAYEHERAGGGDYSSMKYLGVLVRMNKNRVRAFRGQTASSEHWAKCFAHYINLLVAMEFCRLAAWVEFHTERKLSGSSYEEICTDLGLDHSCDLAGLEASIRAEMSRLQLHVNNPAKPYTGLFSVAESPLRVFVEAMRRDGMLAGKTIYCCIDEYENLLDYQQAILNTYIKHAEEPLSYKIGLRRYGLRTRQTIDGNDLLNCPDDYEEIVIAADGFDAFARSVVEARLRRANQEGVMVPTQLKEFLGDLSFAEEARTLGAGPVAQEVRDAVAIDVNRPGFCRHSSAV